MLVATIVRVGVKEGRGLPRACVLYMQGCVQLARASINLTGKAFAFLRFLIINGWKKRRK